MRSGCRGFESRSGHLIFSGICSVYIDRHIRVDLSDDEHFLFLFLVLCVFLRLSSNSRGLIPLVHLVRFVSMLV